MKTLDINWLAFRDDLDIWLELDVEDRIDLLNPRPLFGSTAFDSLKSAYQLRIWEFGDPRSAKDRMAVDRRCQDFLRVLRALETNRELLKATREEFNAYLSNYLTNGEKLSIGGGLGNPGAGFREYYERIAAERWVKEFLAGGADWERRFLSREQRAYFANHMVLAAAHRIVGDCFRQAQPISFVELEDRYADLDPNAVGAALLGSFRYLLLYPWLEADNREPIFGVWPGIVQRKLLSKNTPPEPVQAETAHGSPFLLDDMTALLVACAALPLRLRANDSEIFANEKKRIAMNLPELPAWFAETFGFTLEGRIQQADYFLRRLHFTQPNNVFGPEPRLDATAAGIQWLREPADERLKLILDALKTPDAMRGRSGYGAPGGVPFLPVAIDLYSEGKLADGISPAVRDQFREAPADNFVALGDFCEYQARKNPISAAASHRKISGSFGYQYFYDANQETVEQHWAVLLTQFCHWRLLPLGAAEAGYTPERATCIRLTPLGKYLLGTGEEFHWAGDQGSLVIVQPNFEVVFLGPSPFAEAEISRFAERKGKQMGVLFTITKKSIFNAAAAGLTSKAILDTLQRVCGKTVPANVSREIEGWAALCRRVEMGPATLVRCPDAETAMRIRGAAPDAFVPISDTVLELNGRFRPQDMARKLRAMGIFL